MLSPFYSGILVGLFSGVFVGVAIMCLMIVAGDGERG